MSTSPHRHQGRGPFRADQLRPGDSYELSNGHPIECMPSGGRNSRANLVGGLALSSDPAVDAAGFDTGYSSNEFTLRAPDLAIGGVPDTPGWVRGTPPLAVEYADTGQDEADLAVKIRELLAAGTRLVWVVRLTGPRRVEVHRPGAAPEVQLPGHLLEAPGILANPVPVEALYDPAAAQEVALRNLLQRRGYAGLDAVRAQGQAEGEVITLRSAILDILEGRGLVPNPAMRARVSACESPETLRRWLRRAAVCSEIGELLDPT